MTQSPTHPITRSPNAPILQDFVFGGIESDESRLLANERARWQGIRHEQGSEAALYRRAKRSPPSTKITSPVVYSASTRKRTAWATSSARPQRRSSVPFSTTRSCSGV